MKKHCIFAMLFVTVTLIILPVAEASAATISVSPTTSAVYINGVSTYFEAYNIRGNNFFKLRDLAMALNGTQKQFEVSWDAETGIVSIYSNTPYTPVGGEMVIGDGAMRQAIRNEDIQMVKDGEPVTITAYLVGGNNFVRLRDIMHLLDVGVIWDLAANAVRIDTAITYLEGNRESQRLELKSRLVAHAGGAAYGFVGTNSLQALQQSAARGFSLIEIDLITSSDNYIVLNHSWETMPNRVPGASTSKVSRDEFLEKQIFNQLTTMCLPQLIEFLSEHPNISIITDTKGTDYLALYIIARDFPSYINRFIPQAYSFSSVQRLRDLGFSEVIVTLYKMPEALRNDSATVVRRAAEQRVNMITIADELATAEFVQPLVRAGLRVFVHTIDCAARANELMALGVHGVYTAFLSVDSDNQIYDFAYIEIEEKLNQARSRVASLSETERGLLGNLLIYQLNSSITLHRGAPALVGSQARMAAPFSLNGELYLPLRRTVEFLGAANYTWHSDTRSVSAHIPGHASPVFFAHGQDGVLLYHDMFFIRASRVEYLFSTYLRIDGEYIIFASTPNLLLNHSG